MGLTSAEDEWVAKRKLYHAHTDWYLDHEFYEDVCLHAIHELGQEQRRGVYNSIILEGAKRVNRR